MFVLIGNAYILNNKIKYFVIFYDLFIIIFFFLTII